VISRSAASLSGGWTTLGGQLLHAAIALGIGMILFRFGLFGGGDASFLLPSPPASRRRTPLRCCWRSLYAACCCLCSGFFIAG